MPTLEEEQAAFYQEVVEREAFDQEIAERVGPTDPDNLFRLGQANPTAPSVIDAIRELMPQPTAEQQAALAHEFADAQARPFAGSIVAPEELEALKAEQVPATPTQPKVAAYGGDPALIDRSNWHTLDDIEAARNSLRSPQGQEMTVRVREVPLAAFLTEVLYPLPAWTDRHVFAELEPEGTVRYCIGYTQAGGFLVNHQPPDWAVQALLDLPSVFRDVQRSGPRIEP